MIRFERWESANTSERVSFGASTNVKVGEIVRESALLSDSFPAPHKILRGYWNARVLQQSNGSISIPTPAHILVHIRIVIGHPF